MTKINKKFLKRIVEDVSQSIDGVVYGEIINLIRSKLVIPDDFPFAENEGDKNFSRKQEKIISDLLNEILMNSDLKIDGMPVGAVTLNTWLKHSHEPWSSKLESECGDIVICTKKRDTQKEYVRLMSVDVKAPTKQQLSKSGIFYGPPSVVSLHNMVKLIHASHVPGLYISIASNRSFKLLDPIVILDYLMSANSKYAFIIVSTDKYGIPKADRREKSNMSGLNEVKQYNGQFVFYSKGNTYKDYADRKLSDENDEIYFVSPDDFVSSSTLKNVDEA